MKRFLMIAVLALAVSACAHDGTATEVQFKTISVTKRGPCPAVPVYERIKASRPNPLRNQVKPSTGTERVARTSAQLGLYEREGGWADQVMTVLGRCQVASEETEEAQGVANKP